MNNRLFIFDLDGVLVDSKKIHFDSLNIALKEVDEKYVISEDDQYGIFEGLTTKQKLKILTETRNLPEEYHEKIWKSKQEKSIKFFENLPKDEELIEIFKVIREYNVDVAVASNCIKETVEACLTSLGLIDHVNLYLANEDVVSPKPNPEIYLMCMENMQTTKWHTVIFEDSLVGKSAAVSSGAKLVSIKNRSDLNMDLVLSHLNPTRKNINVLIPMAGEGSRFVEAGYAIPKPLIEIDGKTMINIVHDSIDLDAHFIFVAKEEHVKDYDLYKKIGEFCNDFEIVVQKEKLEGATCSALLAKDIIDNDSHLIIVNSDQYIRWNAKDDMNLWVESGVDGAVMTFQSNEDKWSYVELKDPFVRHVYEKVVVGQEATCGLYYWKSGSDFVKYAQQMIDKGIRTNNEFYIAPVYNEAIEDQKVITTLRAKEFRGLGTPEDLERYLDQGQNPKFTPKDKSRYFFNNSENVPKNDEDYIESIYEITNSEICVSYLNAKYEVFDSKYDDFKEESLQKVVSAGPHDHQLMLHPIITSIDKNYVKGEKEKSVYVTAYTSRFFHIYLELLPKLFFLKRIDPDFKLIILADTQVDRNGIFVGLNSKNAKNLYGREEDASSLAFWLEALDIDFECVTLKDLMEKNLTFAKSYVFYERKDLVVHNAKKEYCDQWLNPSVSNMMVYFPAWLLHRSNGPHELDIINYTRNEINAFLEKRKKVKKKIYISRKNYERVHPNEIGIENYFRERGFESVCMEDFTPEEQINICRSASDIVCYVGSSMVNLYHLDPLDDGIVNITVLALAEPRQPEFIDQMYNHYSNIITSESQKFSQNIKIRLIDIPPIMEVPQVHRTLQRMLNL